MSGDAIKNENVGLYISASMSYLSKMYSFNNMGTWPIYKKSLIYLPTTSSGSIDYDFMDTCISAIKKQCIAALLKAITEEPTANEKLLVQQPNKGNVNERNNSSKQSSEDDIEMLMAADPFERYKWEGFDQSIVDFFGGDKTILVGCYKGKKYHDWINTHNLYTIRLGKGKGSMETDRDLFESASLLILYELGKPNKLSAYKITGHQEMSEEELLKLEYPNKKPRKSYMAFSITPLDMDLTFLAEHHLIERLVELNANNAKGTPVFIEQ